MNAHASQPVVESPLLAGLIRNELLEWTRQLHDALESLDQARSEASGASPSERRISANAAEMTAGLIGKMETLACLAETYGEPNAKNNERFFVASVLFEILAARPDARWPRFTIKPHGPEIAPVYGNKQWLRTMLQHLLRELEANLGAAQKIGFTFRQLGNHVLLTCHDETLPIQDMNRPRQLLPLETELTFSFCRRIAELHGGVVRLDIEEESGQRVLTGFTLSLPTSTEGAPEVRRCEDCPLVEQIERYAADLAELLDRGQ